MDIQVIYAITNVRNVKVQDIMNVLPVNQHII